MFQELKEYKWPIIAFFGFTFFLFLLGLGRYQILSQGRATTLAKLSGSIAPIRIAEVDGDFVTLRDTGRANRLLREIGDYTLAEQIDYTVRMTALNQLRDKYSLRAVCDDFLKLKLEQLFSDDFSLCLSEMHANIYADTSAHEGPRLQIEALYDRVQGGESIALIASQKSDDASSESAGDIGYFSEDELTAHESVWFNLDFEEVSQVTERDEDFAFVEVYDVLYDGADKDQVGLYLVTKKKNGIQEVIDAKNVNIFVES